MITDPPAVNGHQTLSDRQVIGKGSLQVNSMPSTKRCLLLVAHGSRRSASNDEVRQLTRRLKTRLNDRFAQVACAFLELADPSIPAGLQILIDHGASDIEILPYFLAAGNHVAEDIPALVTAKQADYPLINIHINPYLGASDELLDLLARTACRQSNG